MTFASDLRVQAPPGQPLQPEATGVGMEATKCLEPSDSPHVGDGASVRAATRANAEQASTRTMCSPSKSGRLPNASDFSQILSESGYNLLKVGSIVLLVDPLTDAQEMPVA